jgi:hypothetical protein
MMLNHGLLTNKMESYLMIWARKILRKIYGPTYGNSYWRIKINQEIYNKFKPQDIAFIIKVHAQVIPIEWPGHVVRVDGIQGQSRSYWKANQEEGERKKKEDLD